MVSKIREKELQMLKEETLISCKFQGMDDPNLFTNNRISYLYKTAKKERLFQRIDDDIPQGLCHSNEIQLYFHYLVPECLVPEDDPIRNLSFAKSSSVPLFSIWPCLAPIVSECCLAKLFLSPFLLCSLV